MKVEIEFDIVSFWHAGTGRGDGAVADAVVARTAAGLPCLPGRTVKGLLRDAAELGEEAGVVPAGRTAHWFGHGVLDLQGDADERDRALEEARFLTTPGRLAVSSATLPEAWERWAEGDPAERSAFFQRFATTALDERGIAKDQTLRVIELAVPLCLRATLDGLEGEEDARAFADCLLFVRCLGSHRNRGLGRVEVRMAGRA